MKTQEEINAEYVCPVCGEVVVNGVGPSGMPIVTTVLNKLPSSHVFYRPACQHDVDYHLQIGKKEADIIFLKNMKKAAWDLYPVVERDHWYSWFNPKKAISALGTAGDFSKRRALIAFAYRNYYAVKWCGKSAYKEGGCKELYKLKFRTPPIKRI